MFLQYWQQRSIDSDFEFNNVQIQHFNVLWLYKELIQLVKIVDQYERLISKHRLFNRRKGKCFVWLAFWVIIGAENVPMGLAWSYFHRFWAHLIRNDCLLEHFRFVFKRMEPLNILHLHWPMKLKKLLMRLKWNEFGTCVFLVLPALLDVASGILYVGEWLVVLYHEEQEYTVKDF